MHTLLATNLNLRSGPKLFLAMACTTLLALIGLNQVSAASIIVTPTGSNLTGVNCTATPSVADRKGFNL
jgi:hypothetical protein